MVTGMRPLTDGSLCESWVNGKLRERPYHHSSRRGEFPLEFIHVDFLGRLAKGYGGAEYFAVFVEDVTLT
jgi:hypothetical protein